MPTKEQVKQSIDTIKDKGQNSAKTVRTVLNEIVDYATPQESGGNNQLQTFSFQGTSVFQSMPPTGGPLQDVCNLKFSIRGISGLFANITFSISFQNDLFINGEEPEVKMSFPIKDNKEMLKNLDKVIYKTEEMLQPTFLLSVTNKEKYMDREYSGNFPTNFRLVNFKIDFDAASSQIVFTIRKYAEYSMLFARNDYASTSISIHAPENFG